MIVDSNPISKILWVWQANRKLYSKDIPTQYTSLYILGIFGKYKHVVKIVSFLSNSNQALRNKASDALKQIYTRLDDIIERAAFEKLVYGEFETSSQLTHKLAIIEIIRVFSLQKREEFLGPLITESENDLQYIVVRSLADTENFDLLDAVLDSADTIDLILRKSALRTWYEGIRLHELPEVVTYAGPRMHYVIRAAYELQTEGDFLRKLLSNTNQNDLPKPKAYPDFIIRYFTELLGKWDYDPDAYRALHAILVPSYFTFDQSETLDEDRPFIIL
ncbi:MAG: hypothetical protein GPJ54_08970 [Candidatus Heimdallarchaeota archaeon]|nr:hypothetical protein [Candidatus Heimdallarchaeota archaeon]